MKATYIYYPLLIARSLGLEASILIGFLHWSLKRKPIKVTRLEYQFQDLMQSFTHHFNDSLNNLISKGFIEKRQCNSCSGSGKRYELFLTDAGFSTATKLWTNGPFTQECACCQFFKRDYPLHNTTGQCIRNPPSIPTPKIIASAVGPVSINGTFVQVFEDDYCGEFKTVLTPVESILQRE